MPVNKNEITKEMLEKAMQCKTAEAADVDLTKEEAEAYFDELSECELKDGDLRHVAGGLCGDVGAPPVGPSNYQ